MSRKNRKKFAATAYQPNISKVATAAVLPAVEKRPVAVPFISSNDAFPSWRIGRLELVDPFGWHEVTGDKILEIRGKLANFESMTWNEILLKSKKQNHTVPVADLCTAAQHRLISMRLDADELVSLRLTGKERVWGYRDGSVLHVLWWDPEHQVCPSLLKNT